MGNTEHNGHEKLTLLESMLRLHGDFRRSLEQLHVTPLQAGVILFLCRHEDGRVKDLATITHWAKEAGAGGIEICAWKY